jgi:segregation and condensation protein B
MADNDNIDENYFPPRAIGDLIPHIEALIFASDKPLTNSELAELLNQAFGFMEDKVEQEQVDAAIEGIVEKYNTEFYPFEVRQSGGGWQFLTKKDFHKTVAQLNGEKFLKRLSAAALETLAIIAYKQPITKGEIESIRGVSSDYSVQKLLEKELIVISGRNEKMPGHPLVYVTSKSFMDYFGINSPEDLPKIKEVMPDLIIEPTIINHTDFEQSDLLSVADDGTLIAKDDALEEGHVNGHSFGEMMPADDSDDDVEIDADAIVLDDEESEEDDIDFGKAGVAEDEIDFDDDENEDDLDFEDEDENIESGNVSNEDEGDDESANDEEENNSSQ